MIAAISAAVTQALQAAAATPSVQFVPDSQVPVGRSSVPPRTDSSAVVQPDIEASGAVQGTVQNYFFRGAPIFFTLHVGQ